MGHAWWETIVLLRRQGYTTIKYYADINGEDRGGDDSKGDGEGGKGGNGGRGYEFDGDDGDDGDDDGGGDGGDDDAKRRQT